MKLTKQRLKEIIKEELGEGLPVDTPEASQLDELVLNLQAVVEKWAPETEEGIAYEADILELLGRFEKPLRLSRPKHDPLDRSPRGRRRRTAIAALRRAGIRDYPLDRPEES